MCLSVLSVRLSVFPLPFSLIVLVAQTPDDEKKKKKNLKISFFKYIENSYMRYVSFSIQLNELGNFHNLI